MRKCSLTQSILFLPCLALNACCAFACEHQRNSSSIGHHLHPYFTIENPVQQLFPEHQNFKNFTQISKFQHYTYPCHRQVSLLKKRPKHIPRSMFNLTRGLHQISLGDQIHMLLNGMRMCQARKNHMCLSFSLFTQSLRSLWSLRLSLDCACPCLVFVFMSMCSFPILYT